MKTELIHRLFAGGACALLAVSSALAADQPAPSPNPPAHERQVRVQVVKGDEGPREKVTFLGVETAPVSPTLTEQLGLKPGFGLVVVRVVEDSPAAAVLKPHDILTKLNDQLLVDQRQLSVLVRGMAEGTEVELTYVRSGKEQRAKVKLTQRELPRMALLPGAPGMNFEWRGAPLDRLHESLGNLPERVRDDVRRAMEAIRREGGPRRDVIIRSDGRLPRLTAVGLGRATIVFSDEAGTVELRQDEGRRHLTVKAPDGKVTFEGDVTTPEQRAALSDDVKARLAKVESVDALEFKVGDDFQSEEQVLPPPAAGVTWRAAPGEGRRVIVRREAGRL